MGGFSAFRLESHDLHVVHDPTPRLGGTHLAACPDDPPPEAVDTDFADSSIAFDSEYRRVSPGGGPISCEGEGRTGGEAASQCCVAPEKKAGGIGCFLVFEDEASTTQLQRYNSRVPTRPWSISAGAFSRRREKMSGLACFARIRSACLGELGDKLNPCSL